MSDIEFTRFKKILRDNEHFVTKARLRLFAILHHHSEVSIKELTQLADKNDQATVYRNLNLFEKLGIIHRLRLGWHSKVELSDMFKHHHHHLTCLKCSQVFDLPENLIIEEQIAMLAKVENFRQADHQLEIRGICQNCQKLSQP